MQMYCAVFFQLKKQNDLFPPVYFNIPFLLDVFSICLNT